MTQMRARAILFLVLTSTAIPHPAVAAPDTTSWNGSPAFAETAWTVLAKAPDPRAVSTLWSEEKGSAGYPDDYSDEKYSRQRELLRDGE